MALSPGAQLGAYEIVELIGEGAMGEVYRARDTRLHREVAVKVLPERLARDAEAQARFEREAQAVAALSHPNILAIHDVGSSEGMAWAVTELLQGKTLQTVLQERRLSQAEALELGRQIVEGVVAAHDRGIVHRDLKPENIFVTQDGRVKILDFGLAKSGGPSTGREDPTLASPTVPGTVLGTVGYMSPEQVRGEEADRRSDLFSLGAVLYEMFTGERVFRRATAAETMTDILKHEPSLTTMPRHLEPVVRRCLAKRREDRFESGRAILEALAAPSSASTDVEEEGEKSIAVLPFANLSADPENEYFSDGVTEEIINALTQIRHLRVAARTSSFYFKGRSEELRTIGQKLDVRTVLEGSVRRAGDRLRITAQLVNVADGYHIWSERFDRQMDDIFAIQDEIASAIAERLKVTLSDRAGAATEKQGPQNPEAYDLYLKGRFFWEQRALPQALGCFERSLELDPTFAAAHAGLAEAYVFLGFYGLRPPGEAMPRGRAAAEKALELDPDLAAAHNALAMVSWLYDWDGEKAEERFRRAIDLNPGDTTAHESFAFFLTTYKGHFDEALSHAHRARELDPLGALPGVHVGIILTAAGRTQEAIEVLAEVVAREPSSHLAQRMLGLAYYEAALYDKAADAFQRALELFNRHHWLLVELGITRIAQGRISEAQALQEEALEQSRARGVSPGLLAFIPFLIGDKEAFLLYLEKSYESRDPGLALANHWPAFAPVREEPHFQEILKRAGL